MFLRSRTTVRVLAGVVSLGAAGCSDAASRADAGVECASSAIVNGHEAPRLFTVRSDQLRAIVGVLLPSAHGGGSTATCTGIMVAPGFVLTAAHCIDVDRDGGVDHPIAEGVPDATIEVATGTDAAPHRYRVDAAWLHPALDVALLEAKKLGNPGNDVPTLPLLRSPVDATWVGSPVEIAGVGVNESGAVGPLRFAIEPVANVLSDHLLVDGRGQTGACLGDSGGPALARSDDGTVRVVGLLDAGDASCVGEDYYTRVDRIADWEPLRTNVPVRAASTECGGLDEAGVCLRGHAFSCVDGELFADDCSAKGEVCGFSDGAGGFRCEAAALDACEGLGSFATCDEDGRLVTCREGNVVAADCGACAGSCVDWASPSGAACL